ncbi:MAG: hypothetical protein FJ109_04345 [Deltaproteobacteria bacterium]|nr:hypothetical protein [Deltaproteobacteria bacterium]
MNLLLYAWYLFALFYAFLLPAWLLGKVLYPQHRQAVRMSVGLALVVTVLPVMTFGLSMLLSTHLSETLLLVVASLCNVGCAAVLAARFRKRTRALEE